MTGVSEPEGRARALWRDVLNNISPGATPALVAELDRRGDLNAIKDRTVAEGAELRATDRPRVQLSMSFVGKNEHAPGHARFHPVTAR